MLIYLDSIYSLHCLTNNHNVATSRDIFRAGRRYRQRGHHDRHLSVLGQRRARETRTAQGDSSIADGFIINQTNSPQNSKGEPVAGYFITAYRALTTVRQTRKPSPQDIFADHRGISGSVDGHQGRLCEMGSRAGEKPDKQGITGWRYLTIARFGRRCSVF